MRLFVALLPPEDAAAELARTVRRLQNLPGADDLRWTERRNWHLTLAFYGYVAEDQLPGLCERLARAAGWSASMRLGIAGSGRFGKRSLWAGIDGPQEDLRMLAASCAAAGRRSGIAMEDAHRFRAHLTVAYTRGRADVAALGQCAEELAGFTGTPWTADELVLFRSHLPAGGLPGEQPRYERLAGWTLGG